MELIGVVDAKGIRLLSMIPRENEYIILHNSRFKVRVALSYADARLLDEEHKVLRDNVDLVILECDGVRPSEHVSPLAIARR
jgi:hypothetical protein